MTEFNEIDLAKDISDMEEDEAKNTLADFMEAHRKNTEAYDELQTEFAGTTEEYEQKLEKRNEKIEEFTADLAEEAAEYVNIPADLIQSRFSVDEIEQIIEEGAEFSESDEDEEEGDSITTFSDKPEKGQTESSDAVGDRDRAAQKLSQKGLRLGDY